MASTYEKDHNDFVISENGTSYSEILSVLASSSILPLMSSLVIPWLIPASFTIRFGQDILSHLFVRFLVEFPMIAVLQAGLVTVMTGDEDYYSLPSVVLVIIVLICVLTFTINHTLTRPKWTSVRKEFQKLHSQDVGWDNVRSFAMATGNDRSPKYPFVTNLRGMVTYITIFTILAVDFPLFPRRFAKTKTFGHSLMDIGTASFIFSNGIVAPEAKCRIPSVWKAITSSWPLLLLGMARVVAVKGMEYPEVVEEYGVHWNFFFTLAAVKIFSAVVFTTFPNISAWKLASLLAIIYEALLLVSNFQNGYLLNPAVSRHSSIIAANREGIFSVVGYTALYLGSVNAGKIIWSQRRKTFGEWTNYILKMSFLSIGLYVVFYIYHNFSGNPTCRRVANMSYLLWAMSISYAILTIHACLSLIQVVAQKYGILHGPMVSFQLYVKNLKEAGKYFHPPTLASPIDPTHANPGCADGDSVDQRLDDLNKKLDKALRKAKGNKDDHEVTRLVEHIERELDRIGQQVDLDKTSEAVDSSKYVHLPDLAKSSLFYEAICYNNLAVFLLGNLLTGLVNYIVDTMYARTAVSVSVLLVYVTVLYFVSFVLYWYNLQLKFW